MKNRDYPFFDAEAFADKKNLYLIAITCWVVILPSIAGLIWSLANWEKYSRICVRVFTGIEYECGLAPNVYGISLSLLIFFSLIFILFWFTIDLKRPVLGTNRKGIFINQKFFKRTVVGWDEFSKINKLQNGSLELYFRHPEQIVARQPAHYRFLLKTTYIKKKLPFVIEPDLKNINLIEVIEKYWRAFGPDAEEIT